MPPQAGAGGTWRRSLPCLPRVSIPWLLLHPGVFCALKALFRGPAAVLFLKRGNRYGPNARTAAHYNTSISSTLFELTPPLSPSRKMSTRRGNGGGAGIPHPRTFSPAFKGAYRTRATAAARAEVGARERNHASTRAWQAAQTHRANGTRLPPPPPRDPRECKPHAPYIDRANSNNRPPVAFTFVHPPRLGLSPSGGAEPSSLRVPTTVPTLDMPPSCAAGIVFLVTQQVFIHSRDDR